LGAIGKGLDSKRTKAEAIRAIHEAATEEWIIMERWEEKALGRPLTEGEQINLAAMVERQLSAALALAW